MTKRVLLTGGLGFIGAHTVEGWLKDTDWEIVVLDGLRHAGRVERLTSMEAYDPDRVEVLWHDLRSPIHEMLETEIGHVDYVVNMASDSHVDRSITDPVPFVKNNVDIALNMLEYARKVKPEKYIQIGTDEIFGSAPVGVSHKEDDPLRPSNPYSASKAAQEQISFAYWRTYEVPVILTRTMNNFGERQDIEKYVPMVMGKVMNGEVLTVHGKPTDLSDPEGFMFGNGEAWNIGSRVWLHARNHADALMFILDEIPVQVYSDTVDHPEWFNIAGDAELDNLEIAQLIAEYMGKELKFEMVDFHSSRPGHDLRYSLDGTKLLDAGWVPPMDVYESLRQTVEWALEHPEWL